jgi:starvation-inducible DNA-binding protein
MPNALSESVCQRAVVALNRLLADTITLRDLYKKHHWQVAGPNFYSLHLLFDKHYEGQAELVDAIAERIQLLGGVSVAMAADVASMTRIETPPSGREEPNVQLSRLLHAHDVILRHAHEAAGQADDNGDHGSNDLLSSKVIPANEFQVWFISQHLVDVSQSRQTQHRAA